MIKKTGSLCALILFFSTAFADEFESDAKFRVCFTPGEDCTQQIVNAIQASVSDVWVQAYSFTSRPIENALLEAKNRGVNVQVVLDKSVLGNQKNAAELFARHHIPVWIDEKPGIAHNKVMIIDQTKTITGSFNFTRAAQARNAENVLMIDDAGLAKKYLKNWYRREGVSRSYKPVHHEKIVVPVLEPRPSFFEWLRQLLEWFLNALFHLLHRQ
ncbi:MAG: phospholipase D family protein [Gammaproteobacteria bacterium]|nr:phospholipase D family protein [Gammaproteobacteria bacterium]